MLCIYRLCPALYFYLRGLGQNPPRQKPPLGQKSPDEKPPNNDEK